MVMDGGEVFTYSPAGQMAVGHDIGMTDCDSSDANGWYSASWNVVPTAFRRGRC